MISSWNWPPISVNLGAVLDVLGHRLVDLFELRDERLRAVGALRGQRGAHRVEFLQCGCEIGKRHGVALQQQADHVGRARLGGRVHDGPSAVAAADRHQTLGLEDSQGFPQRHQADVELLDEHFLARQQVAVGQLAVDDLTAEFVGDDLGRPASPQPATGLGADSQCCHCMTMLTAIGALPGVYGVAIRQKLLRWQRNDPGRLCA